MKSLVVSSRIVVFLVVCGLFGSLLTGCLGGNNPTSPTSSWSSPLNCYRVTFLGVTYHADGTSTWPYYVEELECAQDLSNWVLELPDCVIVIGASPEPYELVHPDPNTQLDGIKWATGAGFQSGTFTITLDDHWEVGVVQVAVKGPDVAQGQIAGPSYLLVGQDKDGDGYTVAQGDCNDLDATIHPGAEEICGDGIDQNCDGDDISCDIDDADGDGYTVAQGDCNDLDATIHPGAEEICGDGIDQDCDGDDISCDIDDADGDGYTVAQGDCNDLDATIHPSAEEICGDGIDQDCDGSDVPCSGGNCQNLSIPAGALPPPGECKVWDPDLPAGQQGPPGACDCSRVVPGTCLIDSQGNVVDCD